MIDPEISHNPDDKITPPSIKIFHEGKLVLAGEEFKIELNNINLLIKGGDLIHLEQIKK